MIAYILRYMIITVRDTKVLIAPDAGGDFISPTMLAWLWIKTALISMTKLTNAWPVQIICSQLATLVLEKSNDVKLFVLYLNIIYTPMILLNYVVFLTYQNFLIPVKVSFKSRRSPRKLYTGYLNVAGLFFSKQK